MDTIRFCPGCRMPLPADAPEGLCPACLLRSGLEMTHAAATAPAFGVVPPAIVFNPPTGTTLRYFGDYELLEEVAQGGMGVVYKARQIGLNRVVAVKMILAGRFATADDVKRFRTEAEAAASLQHPNIVAIHEVGEHEGRHYFSMDFVEGQNLAALVFHGPLAPELAARQVQTMAGAIHYAHGKGVLHRDLKPQNVLLDSAGQPRITDFGLAKQTGRDTGLTQTGAVMGSPSYMPPEQAAGRNDQVGPASDVYSLGAILYELVTGRPPFRAASALETMKQVIEAEPAAPKWINPNVPLDLETICLKCLEKDPKRRYHSAQELADDLGRFLNHEPIRARPTTPVERTVKWVRRKPAIAALSAAILTVTILGLAGVVSQWRRAETKAKESQQNLVRLHVANGLRLQETGDLFGALPSFVEALRLEENDPDKAHVHRLRLGVALRQSPRLVAIWREERGITGAVLSPDGTKLAIGISENTVEVREVASGKLITPLLEHNDWADGLAFSPDGQFLATTTTKYLRVWDATTGRSLIQPFLPNNRSFGGDDFRLGFSPDGKLLVVRSSSSDAIILNVQTGQPVLPPLHHNADLLHAEFSPDGRWLLTASRDTTAQVWEVATGKPRFPPLQHTGKSGHPSQSEISGAVKHAAFSRDGKWIVTASANSTARIWNAETGEPVTNLLQQDGLVSHAEFSPDGRYVATASEDNSIRLWSVAEGRVVMKVTPRTGSAYRARFSPDGRRLLVSGRYKSAIEVRVWNVGTGTPEAATPPLLHDDMVWLAAFLPDGDRIVTASWDGKVRVWDITAGSRSGLTLPHPGAVRSAAFSRDGKRAITGGEDKTARIWNTADGTPLTPSLPAGQEVERVAFSPEGRHALLVYGSPYDSKSARIWDWQTGQPVCPPLTHNGHIMHAEFSPDGRSLVTASQDGTAQLWDASSGRPLLPALKHKNWVSHATFSPDGQRLLTCSRDNTAQLWSTRTGNPEGRPFQHGSQVLRGVFSPDGKRIVTACSDQTAQIWNASTGLRTTVALRHYSVVSAIAFSPDGRRVATGSHDNTARIWDASSGEPLTAPLKHDGSIGWVEFSPDGRLLATGGFGANSARVWEVATGQPALPTLPHPVNYVSVATFSPDGARLLTVGGNARLWDMSVDSRSVADWTLMSHLLSGRRLDPNGNMVNYDRPPANSETTANLIDRANVALLNVFDKQPTPLADLWLNLSRKYPADFQSSEPERRRWHQREAWQAEQEKDWFGARFHLDLLLRASPDDRDLQQRRSAAYEALTKGKR